MSRIQAICMFAACAALAGGAALSAQPRAPAAKAPRIEAPQSRLPAGDPCVAIPCFASERWRTVASAWTKGLDEDGAPLDAAAHASKLAEMEEWLRRLAGTYRIAGTYGNRGGKSPVSGNATCNGIGSGPGLLCAITATWKAPAETRRAPEFDKALHNALQPLVMVFGIDPDRSHIRATIMDVRALKVHGVLVDGEVNFIPEAMTSEPIVAYTWFSSWVAARPGGGVEMKFAVQPTDVAYMIEGLRQSGTQGVGRSWIEIDLRLQRERRVDAELP